MKITVLKSTVEAALAPILKMVSAAKLPNDFKATLTFQSDKQKITIGCTLPEQHLIVVLPDAVFDERNTAFDVNLEMFRRLIATAKGDRLSIEQDAAHVVLNSDERFIGQLVPMTSKNDAKFQIPKDADTTVLPTNFANFLLQAFSCTCNEKDRLALSGVNVSSKGIAGTDGKQLFHLPLPLQLKNDVTIPKSKVYATLKHLRWTSLAHWRTASSEWMFSVAGDEFRYTAKTLDVNYPQYWQIIPKEDASDVNFTLTPESVQELQRFLDGNKDDAFARLTVHPDRIEIMEMNDKVLKQRSGVFNAKCNGTNLPCTVQLNTAYLRQFLRMGFLSLSLSSKSPSPIVSTSGVGKYLFMPCGSPTRNVTQVTAPATTQQPKPEIKPAVISKSSTNNPTQNQPKEKTTMTQTVTTPTTTYARPMQPVAQQTPVATNPLDETLANLASMREQLANLEARLLEAGRKIKAALVEQRLKERQYADATRKLERIRLAV